MEPDKFEELAKDPVFVKAAKNLVWNRKQAGDDTAPPIPLENKSVQAWTDGKYTRGQVDAWLTEAAKPSFYNTLQKVGQGISFNFLDELRGKAKGQTAEDAMRLQEDAYSEQNPGKAGAAEIGGSVLNPVNLAAMAASGGGSALLERLGLSGIAKLPALVKAGLLGSGTGAAEGAAYGAGSGTDTDSRAAGAESGAEGGAAAGLLLPAAGAAAKLIKSTMASPAEKAAASVARAARSAGGRDALVASATDQTDAGLTPMLADQPGMEGSHDLAASLDFGTKTASDAVAQARRAAAPDLMAGALNDQLPPGVGTDMGEAAGTMDAARRAEFDPRYKALDAAHPQVGDDPESVLGGPSPYKNAPPIQPDPVYAPMAKLIKRDPEVAAAWKSSMREAQVGETPDMGRPSVATLRNMRGKLQDRVENLFREGSANTALKLKTSINVLNDVLDHETSIPDPVTGEVNPLKSLDAEYRAAMDAKRALDDGRVWYNAQESNGIPHSIAGLQAKLSTMTQAELDAFRTGTASSIVHDLEHAQVNRNVAQELLNSSNYRKQMIRSVFDSGSQMEEFMQKVKMMAQQAKLGRAGGNSVTASRLAGAEGNDPTLSLGDLKNPMGAVGKMGQAAVSATGVTPAKQAFGSAIGKLTMTRGTPAIDDLLQKLLSPESGVPAFLQNPSAAAGAGAAGAASAGSQ